MQIINLHLVISGAMPPLPLDKAAPASTDEPAIKPIEVWLDGESRKAPLYRRADLAPGHRLYGPAVIIQEDTTVVIPIGGKVDRDCRDREADRIHGFLPAANPCRGTFRA